LNSQVRREVLLLTTIRVLSCCLEKRLAPSPDRLDGENIKPDAFFAGGATSLCIECWPPNTRDPICIAVALEATYPAAFSFSMCTRCGAPQIACDRPRGESPDAANCPTSPPLDAPTNTNTTRSCSARARPVHIPIFGRACGLRSSAKKVSSTFSKKESRFAK